MAMIELFSFIKDNMDMKTIVAILIATCLEAVANVCLKKNKKKKQASAGFELMTSTMPVQML